MACHGRGRALIRLGRIAEGVALLDEAMASVIAGEVTPLVAGDVYCSVLEGCQETFDLRRAYEWTTSLAQWCAAQPGLVRYRGECLQYRAEVMLLRGQWANASRDADEACELLVSRPAAGAAFYRRGDVHRLRGEFTAAEDAYMRAHERGHKPQPGLSLLRLAQGQIDAAAASIRSVLLDTTAPAARARMLPAAVEILLAANDVAAARATAAELSEIALRVGAPLLAAATAHATGAVRISEGDIEGASTSLGRVAIAICRDFLDLDLRVALKNAEPAADLVLNPAFSPVTSDFEAAHFEARRSLYACTVFCNFALFGGSRIQSPEKVQPVVLGPGEERVVVIEVPLLAMRAERRAWDERARARFIQSTRH